MGDTKNYKMENEINFPGNTSEEINKNIENNSNIREDKESRFLYPQNLYHLLLQKNVNTEFLKHDKMRLKLFETLLSIRSCIHFSQIIIELGEVRDNKISIMIVVGKDMEFRCMSHSTKATINRSAIDYSIHTLDTNVTLLTNPTYFSDRNHIRDHSALAFPRIVRYLYRILVHT
jgi:hypothetical protein